MKRCSNCNAPVIDDDDLILTCRDCCREIAKARGLKLKEPSKYEEIENVLNGVEELFKNNYISTSSYYIIKSELEDELDF